MLKDNLDLSLEYESEAKIVDVIDTGKSMAIWYEIRTTALG